jgi:cyanate permease
MIGKTTRFRNPAGHAGLVKNLLTLARSLADFFESRFALFAHESKGAVAQLAVIAACLMLALVLCLFGYIFSSLAPSLVWRILLGFRGYGRRSLLLERICNRTDFAHSRAGSNQ